MIDKYSKTAGFINLSERVVELRHQFESNHSRCEYIEILIPYLDTLPERARDILVSRGGLYGKPQSLREIQEKWGISVSRVRQIYDAEVRRLLKRFI